MISTKVFFQHLLKLVPDLQPVYKEHISDYNQLLPHVFMADVTRLILDLASRVKVNDPESERTLSVILAEMERGIEEGNDELKNVIGVSFLENLERNDSHYDLIKSWLGVRLREDLQKIENFYARSNHNSY